ncbi:MAG: preprotein translocase subunit SecY [Fimbriimonadaceae bacterium]|nr:preprotein translocase subunit SecY [Fimbriimonadaceae bacterium]
MAAGALGGSPGGGDKSLRLSLADTLRLAWADDDLRQRLTFVIGIFLIYAMGVQVPVPVPGFDPAQMQKLLEDNAFFNLLNTFGGGAFKRLSIFALGLGPYISASIIMQVLTMGIPSWKEEMKEGGEYARKQQNKRTRSLTLALCVFQGFGLMSQMGPVVAQLVPFAKIAVVIFWMCGSSLLQWLGEQVTERGIGNGISILIFAGIVISIPNIAGILGNAVKNGTVGWGQVVVILALFLLTTYVVVYFTIAQRRIPIEHMRRNFGTKSIGGQVSYLPISPNMAGVIPIIFALALTNLPSMFRSVFPQGHPAQQALDMIGKFFYPDFRHWEGWVAAVVYAAMIFFFTYFYTALQYNVEDMADNLKKHGSFIRGIRPGKQTKEFLDGVISRVTFVGAGFLAIVALTQYVLPLIAAVQNLGLIFGTSLLIMVSVALETMRQIEANLLAKQYEG